MFTRAPAMSTVATLGLPLGLSLALVSSPAAAGSAASSLSRTLASVPSTPQAAAACAPAGTVLQGLGQMVEAMGTGGLAPPEQELVQRLASTEGLAALGIDPQGALALALWNVREDPVGVLSLPFVGEADQARTMLGDLGAEVKPLPDQPASWSVRSPDGTETVATLRDGVLDLAFDGQPPAEGGDLPPIDLPLVEGLPSGPGCALWVALGAADIPAPDALKPAGGLALAGFVPFEKGNLGLIRLRPARGIPQVLARAPAAPAAGTSVDPPSVVLTLGLSAADVLLDPTVLAGLDLSAAKARRILKRVNIGPGATVAVFGDPRGMDLVANLPLDPQAGPTAPRKVIRRLARLARKGEVTVLQRDDQGLVFDLDGTATHVAVREGRVVVGPDPRRVAQAADGEGRPWVGTDDAAWAMSWPIALWSGPDGPTAGEIDLAFRAGVRAVEDVLEVGIQIRTNAPPGMITAMLATVLSGGRSGGGGGGMEGGVVGGVVGGRGVPSAPSPQEEVERAVEGIALAQEVRRSVSGSYLALPPAPRPVEEADGSAVTWMVGEEWSSLGWMPDLPRTAVVYWVEVGADGQSYVVHAETDLDGDGVRAHYLRTNSEPMRRTTPEGVQ